MKKDNDYNTLFRAYAVYSGVSLQLVATVVVGWLVGQYVDSFFNTTPLFLIIGVILGMFVGFYMVYKLIKAHEEKKDLKKGFKR